MYSRIKISWCGCTGASGVLCRYLSSAEISTALRPFYFSVHPDLFGKYPEQRKVNEHSLQQLSALLEAQQASRRLAIPPLSFYLRQKDMPEGEFKLVKIQLNESNARDTIVKVLNACQMSTTYVDKIPRSPKQQEFNFNKADFSKAYLEYSENFNDATRIKRKVEEKKAINNIIDWITDNSALAKEKYDSTSATRDQVNSLLDHLVNTYGIKQFSLSQPQPTCRRAKMPQCAFKNCGSNHRNSKVSEGVSFFKFPSDPFRCAEWISIVAQERREDHYRPCKNSTICSIHFNKFDVSGNTQRRRLLKTAIPVLQVKYDSGWNISHIRGALQSLVSLATQHANIMSNLEGRTIALGAFTGVSLDGDVYLNIIDVRNEWLSLIKKVSQEDSALTSIPNYEETLSGILRNIHIRRRKFMPKVSASQYCNHLRQLVTSLGDFYGRGYKFPESVPESLSKYEIVVEPEAGPLMVSPTGQFITPSSCPAGELIAFIGAHIDEATLLMTEYSINKHIEKALYNEVKERFGLLELQKDDSITPGLMIMCCQRLLTRSEKLRSKLQGNILYITHYYSVLSDGVLCIPWNFK